VTKNKENEREEEIRISEYQKGMIAAYNSLLVKITTRMAQVFLNGNDFEAIVLRNISRLINKEKEQHETA